MPTDTSMSIDEVLAAGHLAVMEIQGREPRSILRPLECRASDEHRYFIKTRRSEKMPLVCEWVCGKLAEVLGLRCPPVEIIWLPEALLREWGESDYDLAPGWTFGSRALDLADTFPKSATSGVPLEERQRVLAFDHWIHNSDRGDANPNLLWRAPGSELWLIDHHLTLSSEPVRRAQDWHVFREDWASCWAGTHGEEIRAWLAGGLAHLDGILSAMPGEWLEEVNDFPQKLRILLTRPLP